MTTIFIGNAAHLDLIFRSDVRPNNSGFGTLLESPGNYGEWFEGGAVFTIALAYARQGKRCAVWHPLPDRNAERVGLNQLISEGVDLSPCPVYEGEPVRSIMVYGEDWRLGWSVPAHPVQLDASSINWSDVTHVVIAPVWGQWSECAVEQAQARGIPVTLVGFSSSLISKYQWSRVIVDEDQAGELEAFQVRSEEWVITNGDKGARIMRNGQLVTRIPAIKANVVDPTGAGDTFAGSYLGAVSQGRDAETAGRIAATFSARICETWGTRPASEFFNCIL